MDEEETEEAEDIEVQMETPAVYSCFNLYVCVNEKSVCLVQYTGKSLFFSSMHKIASIAKENMCFESLSPRTYHEILQRGKL